MTWILLKQYCELTGETREGFNLKRRRGLIAEHKHYCKAAYNKILINMQEMEQWLEK